MISRAVQGLLLTAMWVALWGDPSPGTIIAGVAAAGAVTWLTPRPPTDRRLVLRPLSALRFVAFFLVQLVASTWSVARLILSADARTTRGVVIKVELSPRGYAVRTLIAHSISLTPGTLTVDVGEDGRTLYVHVIKTSDVKGARSSIRALEARACAAFAPAEPIVGSREEVR